MSGANPLRCPSCKKGLLEGRFLRWKRIVSVIMKYTLIFFPWGCYLMSRPDWYECPLCGRKKVFL